MSLRYWSRYRESVDALLTVATYSVRSASVMDEKCFLIRQQFCILPLMQKQASPHALKTSAPSFVQAWAETQEMILSRKCKKIHFNLCILKQVKCAVYFTFLSFVCFSNYCIWHLNKDIFLNIGRLDLLYPYPPKELRNECKKNVK